MVDTQNIGRNEYVTVALVSNLADKRFVILGEGERVEFKDKRGFPVSKLSVPIELVEGNKPCYWTLNDESLKLWKVKWGYDSINWVGKAGLFKVVAVNSFTSVIGEPIANLQAPMLR
jgi:hypothetical protein